MLRISQLRSLLQLSPEAFQERVGRFTLIQRPPDPVLGRIGEQLSSARTVIMAHRSRLGDQMLHMLRNFDQLWVVDLKPGKESREFIIGRLPECDVVVSEPSVSQRHASLRWSAEKDECFLKDLDSRNGTFVNVTEIHDAEMKLMDGDTLAFGDAQFLFFRAETLHSQLSAEAPEER